MKHLSYKWNDSGVTSLNEQGRTAFKIKNMNLTLPTIQYLQKTQLHLYSSSDKCPICYSQEETWAHVMLWRRDYLQLCIESTIECITLYTSDYRVVPDREFMQELSELPIWTIPSLYDPYDVTVTVLDLVRGVIPYSLFYFFKSNFSRIRKLYENYFATIGICLFGYLGLSSRLQYIKGFRAKSRKTKFKDRDKSLPILSCCNTTPPRPISRFPLVASFFIDIHVVINQGSSHDDVLMHH